MFNDDAESNAEPADEAFADLPFTGFNGDPVTLEQFHGQKNVVLVVTKGFYGTEFCPHCTAQTSRLINNHHEFEKRNVEVIVVVPGESGKADEFAEATVASMDHPKAIPFSIVLDEGLVFVDRLGIREKLAKPATYILDKAGQRRYGYVGRTLSDRPTIKFMLKKLDELDRIE